MEETRNNDGMKYLGGAAIIGVPARDLTAEEVKQYGEKLLLASGLYRRYRAVKFAPKPTRAALKVEVKETKESKE